MAEREQILNADMANQAERTEKRVQQEGSQRIERKDSSKPHSLDEQVAERNQEYREADQNAPQNSAAQSSNPTDRDTAWKLHEQQVGVTKGGGQLQGMAGSTDGQESGEGGSTSRSSEAPGGDNRYSTGQ